MCTLKGHGTNFKNWRFVFSCLTKTSCDPFQVMIYNPAFFKYVHEAWLDGHGRYPSTGFLSLLLAVHICDEVRPTKPWGRWRGDARQKLSNQEYFFWSGYLWHGRLHVLHLLQVSVFGFGADQYGNWHHYWEENHLAGAFRHTGIHNGDYEYNVTLLLADKQKIRMFKGRWYVDDQPVNAAFGFFRRGLMFLLINRGSFCPRAIDEAKATLPVVSLSKTPILRL